MATDQNSNSRKGFYIEVGCPGCGGELEIESDLFVTSCTHCGSPLRLVLPESPPTYILTNKLSLQEVRVKIDRHLKSQGLPLTSSSLHFKQIYYPYWKVEAMLLRYRNRKEKISVQIDDSSGEEIVDFVKKSYVNLSPYHITVSAAVHLEGVPDSVGIRGQSLKMKPFKSSSIEDGFDIINVCRAPAEVIKTIELSLSRLSTIDTAEFGENLTRLYNPTTSMMFFPYCIVEDYEGEGYRRYVLDGLTGRILFYYNSLEGEATLETKQDFSESEEGFRVELSEGAEGAECSPIKLGAVEILPHRCGVCGVDLPARASCLYICKNCHEMTCLDGNVTEIPRILVAGADDSDSLYFPFWSYHADRRKYFGSISETNKILIPAFKIPNFEALYRLSCRATTAGPKFNFEPPETLNERFAPVDIFPTVGIALAEIVFCRYELEKTKRMPKLNLDLDTQNLALCFIPFKPENYFFVDSALNSISFEKKLVNT